MVRFCLRWSEVVWDSLGWHVVIDAAYSSTDFSSIDGHVATTYWHSPQHLASTHGNERPSNLQQPPAVPSCIHWSPESDGQQMPKTPVCWDPGDDWTPSNAQLRSQRTRTAPTLDKRPAREN